jgi:hypothetical protein
MSVENASIPIELDERNRVTSGGEAGRNIVFHQLKPIDRGIDAWKVLIAAFLFETLLWGAFMLLDWS